MNFTRIFRIFFGIVFAIIILLSNVEVFAQSKSRIVPNLRQVVSSPAPEVNSPQDQPYVPAEPQVKKVAALRVQFQPDENPLTSGNGTFDLSANPDGLIIDPPPHNRLYFSDHLLALINYYFDVSNGGLTIDADLFPIAEEPYTLSQQNGYYNPRTTDEELDMRLSELARDAIALAEADGVDFTAYSSVIIYHAGVGSDFLLEDAALDPTPQDIPSVHLNLRHLRQTLGGGSDEYSGIPVSGGAHYITSITILPETETKRDVEIGLLGISAHQFGHALGLPSLFNTSNGRPGIGMWGLMGVGFANLSGVVPAEPSAFTKNYMHWANVQTDLISTNNEVRPSNHPSGENIYKISISPTEYYLIENRRPDYNNDGLIYTRGESGVIIDVDDWDIDIPGPGILIWHVDMKMVLDNLESNTVNADKFRRGVDLEEADGSQDIGELFPGILPGFPTPANGIAWDAFYASDNGNFTPETVPSSLSNDRGNSHIAITNISDTSLVMSFDFEHRYNIDNLPIYYLGSDFSEKSPIWTKQSSTDEYRLIIPAEMGLAFIEGGSYVSYPITVVRSYDRFGNYIQVNGHDFWTAYGDPIVGQPVYGDSNDPENPLNEFIIGVSESNKLISFDLTFGWDHYEVQLPSEVTSDIMLTDKITLGFADGTLRQYDADGTLSYTGDAQSSPIIGLVGSDEFVIGLHENGSLFVKTESGLETPSIPNPVSNAYKPLYTIFDENVGDQLVIINEAGQFLSVGNEEQRTTFNVGFITDPVAGDIDGDGIREIMTVGNDNAIYAINYNGTIKTGFPVNLASDGFSGQISTGLILGDVTGDGRQNIIFGTDAGNMFAIDHEGTVVNGFPLPMGLAATGTPTLLRSATADRMELAAFSDEGYFFLWDLETTYDDKILAWPTYGADNSHSRMNSELLTVVAPPVAETELMPAEKCYNWPNPNRGNWTNIRYYLSEMADVSIKIFTQAGVKVAELDGPGVADIDNEVQWDLSNISSGIYFAQVVATGNGKSNSKVIKIAVIK